MGTLTAIGVPIGSGWVVIAAVVLLLLLDRLVVPCEEASLTAEFPEEFAAYRRRVRRWV